MSPKGSESSRSRPTSRDVAALAGVSVATVSYVVNGREDRVGPETRERVQEAARRLGYAPNSSARGLKRRRTERVCLVMSQIGVPAHDQLARDLHAAAARNDHAVITMVVDSEARAEQAFDLLQQRIADGAVLAAVGGYLDADRLHDLVRSGLPMVVQDNAVAARGFDVVRTPEREFCAHAFRHLLEAGRRRIAFVGQESDLRSRRSGRWTAYAESLEDAGISIDESLVVSGADSRVDGYSATASLLDRDPSERPDAVFAATDRAAISAIWAIRDVGLTVPDDIAVVGVGNLPDGLITRPALSTVGQSTLDYSAVVDLLFSRIASPSVPDRELVLPWEFIRRDSA